MNVYDFDDTIYNGDSSVDFFKFCIQKNPLTLCMLPRFGFAVIGYTLRLISKEQLKSAYFSFVRYIKDIDDMVTAFWDVKQTRIKDFYKSMHQDTDIIISASPEFLLKPMTDRLQVRLLATQVDPRTGKFLGGNCRGKEKVRRLAEFTEEPVDKFFSDSLSDTPLSQIAKEAFLVKGDSLIPWPGSAEQS